MSRGRLAISHVWGVMRRMFRVVGSFEACAGKGQRVDVRLPFLVPLLGSMPATVGFAIRFASRNLKLSVVPSVSVFVFVSSALVRQALRRRRRREAC